MDKCKAYKNKTIKIQCSAKIKSGFFCGKHQTIDNPIYNDNGVLITSSNIPLSSLASNSNSNSNKVIGYDALNTYKKIAGSDVYNQYLDFLYNI